MNRIYTEDEACEVAHNGWGDRIEFYDRFTNLFGLRFFLFRDSEVHLEASGHKEDWYVNFHGFFESNSEFEPQAVIMTFGVREMYRNACGLMEDSALEEYLFLYGDFEFQRWLNTIAQYSRHLLTVIRKWGDQPPDMANGKIVPPRDTSEDRRILRLAEQECAKAVLSNNGLKPLASIDFEHKCFLPSRYVRQVKKRIIRDEFMDTEFGVLTEKGTRFMEELSHMEKIPISLEDPDGLIRAGESSHLEFKQTLRWDVKKKSIEKELEFMVVKAIAGLVNSDGGTVLIGVADDGAIHGLEDDFRTLGKCNWDKFQLHLWHVILSYFPKGTIQQLLQVQQKLCCGSQICAIMVKPATTPLFIDKAGKERLYVRFGNSTREIEETKEIASYCIRRFGRGL